MYVTCIIHGFLGQSQHNRFSSPPGRFSQGLGLTSDLYKVYRVPGFQRALSLRGTVLGEPGIEMLSGELPGLQSLGMPLVS